MHLDTRTRRGAGGTRSRIRAAGIAPILAALITATGAMAVLSGATLASGEAAGTTTAATTAAQLANGENAGTTTTATPAAHNPTGTWRVTVAGRRVHFYGNAADPDATSSITVVYYLNGRARETARTQPTRFDRTWTLPYGTHTVKVAALNVGAGSADTVIGSKRVRLVDPATYNPHGYARFSHRNRALRIVGRTYDPDRTSHPVRVRVFVNGHGVAATRSNPRTHRFALTARLHAGVNHVRVISYNIGKGTHNRLDGRATVRVRRASTTAYHGNHAIASRMVAARGWGAADMSALIKLWNRESGWRTSAANPSGAYGIPQALPGGKMSSAGSDWRTNPATQIAWGLSYIRDVYGSPRAAWVHEMSSGWY
jgi:hypothetical protein